MVVVRIGFPSQIVRPLQTKHHPALVLTPQSQDRKKHHIQQMMIFHDDITCFDFSTTLMYFAHHANRMMLMLKSMHQPRTARVLGARADSPPMLCHQLAPNKCDYQVMILPGVNCLYMGVS